MNFLSQLTLTSNHQKDEWTQLIRKYELGNSLTPMMRTLRLNELRLLNGIISKLSQKAADNYSLCRLSILSAIVLIDRQQANEFATLKIFCGSLIAGGLFLVQTGFERLWRKNIFYCSRA